MQIVVGDLNTFYELATIGVAVEYITLMVLGIGVVWMVGISILFAAEWYIKG